MDLEALPGVVFGPGVVVTVSDMANNRVSVFHPNGTLAFGFGAHGQEGEHGGQPDVALSPNGLFAVYDIGNNRVQIFRLR